MRNSVLSASSGSADNIHLQLVAVPKNPCPKNPVEEGMAGFSGCCPCPYPLKAVALVTGREGICMHRQELLIHISSFNSFTSVLESGLYTACSRCTANKGSLL